MIKSYVTVVPLTYVILISLLSFDMPDCTLAAMDEIYNNDNNNNKPDFTIWLLTFCPLSHLYQESKISINIPDLKNLLGYIILPNRLHINVLLKSQFIPQKYP
jgi:hypothetical protein